MRAAVVAFVALASASSCHLASSPQQDCPAGTHPELGACAQDPVQARAIVIAAGDGGDCAPSPDPYTIASGQVFHFVNQTDADRQVVGADGQVWAAVPKGQTGPDEKIDKIGSWAYQIAGCKGGTVIVQ